MIDFSKSEFETSFGRLSQFNPDDEFLELAFAGRSNVGKSSLLNKLMNRRSLARVSSTPGKTVTINFYKQSEDLRLVDLPGYGYAKRSKSEIKRWADLIGGYYNLDRNLILTVLLIDSRHDPSKDDMEMLEFLVNTENPCIIAFTKIDKLSSAQLAERKERFETVIFNHYDILFTYTSTKTGEGIEELKELISEAVEI